MPKFPLDGRRRHQLLPDTLAASIPDLYSQEGVKDPIVRVKFFCPYSSSRMVWYVTEFSTEDGDSLFGWADLGMGGGELGYMSLEELANTQKNGLPLIERDCYWTPKPLSECIKGNL